MKRMERKHSVLLCDIILLFVSSETNPRKTSINARSILTALFECKIQGVRARGIQKYMLLFYYLKAL